MTLQDFISMQILHLNFSQKTVVFIDIMVSNQIGEGFSGHGQLRPDGAAQRGRMPNIWLSSWMIQRVQG